jgi:hypothetical protein
VTPEFCHQRFVFPKKGRRAPLKRAQGMPVTGLLQPSPARSVLLTNLTPASGRQNHTTSPSALTVAILTLRYTAVQVKVE